MILPTGGCLFTISIPDLPRPSVSETFLRQTDKAQRRTAQCGEDTEQLMGDVQLTPKKNPYHNVTDSNIGTLFVRKPQSRNLVLRAFPFQERGLGMYRGDSLPSHKCIHNMIAHAHTHAHNKHNTPHFTSLCIVLFVGLDDAFLLFLFQAHSYIPE